MVYILVIIQAVVLVQNWERWLQCVAFDALTGSTQN